MPQALLESELFGHVKGAFTGAVRDAEGRLAPGAAALRRQSWPGNVRELRNVLSYAYVIGEGPVLLATDLPPEIAGADPEAEAAPPPAAPPPAASGEAERIRRALDRAAGSRARAAKILGISRVTLWRRMKELGLAEGG